MGSCIKPNDVSKKNIYENSGEKNNAHYPNRKTRNNQSCKPQCENPLCNYVFNSSKEQNTSKLKGLNSLKARFNFDKITNWGVEDEKSYDTSMGDKVNVRGT